MSDANRRPGAEAEKKPQNQTGEKHGNIKSRQRGEGDFKGHGDTPRGSEPETGQAARHRI